MNCLEYLKRKEYDLRGYSSDTIIRLQESNNIDECESLMWYLEAVYG